MKALLLGTLTLRTATGTTGALLIVWNKYLNSTGSVTITPVDLATITLAFYVTELLGSPIFGIIADRPRRGDHDPVLHDDPVAHRHTPA
jgi:MFS family permease